MGITGSDVFWIRKEKSTESFCFHSAGERGRGKERERERERERDGLIDKKERWIDKKIDI